MVKQHHGQYMCRCGRKLAGCNCPEHKQLIAKVYPNCDACTPGYKTPKEKMGVVEKDGRGSGN